MNRCWIATVVVVLVLLAASSAVAEVRLPQVIGDHMVLQRNVVLNIWGWGNKGEKITVELGALESPLVLGVGRLPCLLVGGKLLSAALPHRLHQFTLGVANEVGEGSGFTVLLPHKK